MIETLEALRPLMTRIPFLANLSQANAFESQIDLLDLHGNKNVKITDKAVFKVYKFRSLLENQSHQMEFMLQRSITYEAK
jgi:hypothetical protein